MLTSSNCESRGESSYLKFHGLNFQWRSSFFVCFRIRVTWPMKCDIICTRNCVAWYVCVAGVFVTWSAHNWLLHAIELCILTFLKRTKKGTLESVKNRLHLIEIHPIQIWDFDKLKTQNTPFTNPFSSIPNDILTEITIKSDRDLLTDGLGAPNNCPTARLLKTIQAFWKNDSILRISPRTNYYKYRNFRNSSTQFSETGICLKCKRKWIYLNLSFS